MPGVPPATQATESPDLCRQKFVLFMLDFTSKMFFIMHIDKHIQSILHDSWYLRLFSVILCNVVYGDIIDKSVRKSHLKFYFAFFYKPTFDQWPCFH